MNLVTQIKLIIFSIFFGIYFSLFSDINYSFLNNENYIRRFFFTTLYSTSIQSLAFNLDIPLSSKYLSN